MKIGHYMRRERSGLVATTLELVEAEECQGHRVFIQTPSEGDVLYGVNDGTHDVDCIHSQISTSELHSRRPKVMWCHGEPLSSVANGVSMRAIADLAPKLDCFIAMREEEYPIWSSLRRTFVVPKGIDLQRFRPLMDDERGEKLSGEPAVLYAEHWRGQRNPLYLCVAMERVVQRYPKARLHLYNCTSQKMLQTFLDLSRVTHWSSFLRSIKGPVADPNVLYNRADLVVSCLYPLYARSIECLGAGVPFLGPGYTDPDYPYHCTLDPDSMADAICRAWEDRAGFNARKWAERKHDVQETVRQSIAIYERYL